MPRALPPPALYVEQNDAGELVLRSKDGKPPAVRLRALGIEAGATFYVVRPDDMRGLVSAARLSLVTHGAN